MGIAMKLRLEIDSEKGAHPLAKRSPAVWIFVTVLSVVVSVVLLVVEAR